ncbi:serine/threonine-protein kinase [Streptomyces sp. NPDC091292]|uniref:serine/threonine-protein kinase n=1 Tax=Streptomyces sp. NPDC091292 TaxID=3365991 RepID=UPI0037FCEF00
MEQLGAGDPQRIGAYRLLARLGAGGMGQVYLARSDRGRTVAVKLVRQELAEQEEFRGRFRQEVRAALRVGGQWTAPVLDADTDAPIPWVATGYVAGPSLQTVVGHDHGALPERSVRILAAGLAHALKDIHAAELIHRDLKPSNVLITIDGPRVIDFGIARALETVTDGGLTRTGALVGSPGFMAPEQVRGDRITPACDVFCLGSVLAYAATGALPFGTANSGVHALMFRIAQEEPDLSALPEGLADLVRDCLHKDPASRPSLDDILARTGAEDTVSDGRALDPWLPGALVAQLGRHAVQLLDAEDPGAGEGEAGADSRTEEGGAEGGVAPQGEAAAEAAPDPRTDNAAPAPPGTPPPPSFDHLPTQLGATPPPTPPASPYGYPQGTPTPYAYGYPQQQPPGAPGSTPPYGPSPYGSAAAPVYGITPPYGPPPVPEPPRRGSRSTAVLAAVALVVALGAGGAVYALMKDDGDTRAKDDPKPTATSGAPSTPGPSTEDPPTSSAPPQSSAPAKDDGTVPDKYLGTWSGTIDNASGHSTRKLVIQQGEVGDTVMSLTAEGPMDGGGTYRCVFQAELASEPSGDGPLEIGPSRVTVGEPMSSCTPGAATTVTILSDGRLRRVNNDNGDALTYSKS